MDKGKLKQPHDYPQFAFRIPKEIKNKLQARLDRLKVAYNKKRQEDEKTVNKNDILLEAIEIGLTKLEDKVHK